MSLPGTKSYASATVHTLNDVAPTFGDVATTFGDVAPTFCNATHDICSELSNKMGKKSMSNDNDNQRENGRVKWFNNKAGYGFLTVSDGGNSAKDFFVHHSSLNVSEEQYKYLVQGEYVEFELTETIDEKRKWHASSVSGVNGGKLMCETRKDTQSVDITDKSKNLHHRTQEHRSPAQRTHEHRSPVQRTHEHRTQEHRTSKSKGSKTFIDEEGVEWFRVRKR